MLRAVSLGVALFAPVVFAAGPVRVSVLYFDVNSNQPELAVLSKGFAELLTTDLVQSTDVTVIERERLEHVLGELKLGETRYSDPATAARIGKLLGVQFMVVGTINEGVRLKEGFSPHLVTVRLLDVERGAYVGGSGLKVKLDPDDVFATEERIAADVAQLLVKAGAARAANEPPRKAHRLPVKTAVKYAKALDAKDKKDDATAVKLLGEVVREEPDFKLARLDLLNLTK